MISVLFTISHELGGGNHTLRRTQFSGFGLTPYRTINAGGFRAVYDFGDLDRSVYAIATGQAAMCFRVISTISRRFGEPAAMRR